MRCWKQKAVCCLAINTTHLDSAVERSTGKSVGVLRVKHDLHNIVRVTFKDLLNSKKKTI